MDGTYGDESAEVARRLDALSEALASWDRSIRAAEQQLRPRFEGTSPDDAALAHETLGSLYLERGRFSEAAARFEPAFGRARGRPSRNRSRRLRKRPPATPIPPRRSDRHGCSIQTIRSRPIWHSHAHRSTRRIWHAAGRRCHAPSNL